MHILLIHFYLDHSKSHVCLEDIVLLIDGRPEIVGEISQVDEKLKEFLRRNLSNLLKRGEFKEVLPGLLPGDPGSQARVPMILSRLQEVTTLS